MINYYDPKHNRLVVVGSRADEKFWQEHWLSSGDIKKSIESGRSNGLIKKYTSKFLKPPAKIIDAGCGIGQNVYGLEEWGYDAYGVDFARNVVAKTIETFPNLKISVQDVRNLDFPDNFFDGYWSLGVIEHFPDGFDAIIKDANRVIKSGGYLFLTVPWLSPLRKIKAKMGRYPQIQAETDMTNFYEFMLDDKKLSKQISDSGFTLLSRHPYDAVKGLKDEISIFRPILQRIYNSKNTFAKMLRFIITIVFAPFAGHIILLVFKKNEKSL